MFTNFPNMLAGYGALGALGGTFTQTYRCFSVAMSDKTQNLEGGGKILLPASALDTLARLRIEYPMLFELNNPLRPDKKTHCGVLEFTADEGTCFLPYWMMQLLAIEEGAFINIKSVSLPKGTYVKIQPHSTSFIDISNPKAVLENRLRNFCALTQGDVIRIEYNKNHYDLSVVEVKPLTISKAISIIETDLQLDFAAPLDYKEPTKNTTTSKTSNPQPIVAKSRHQDELSDDSDDDSNKKYKPFQGVGYTLSGKSPGKSMGKSPSGVSPKPSSSPMSKNLKDPYADSDSDEDQDKKSKFVPFGGSGNKLR